MAARTKVHAGKNQEDLHGGQVRVQRVDAPTHTGNMCLQ